MRLDATPPLDPAIERALRDSLEGPQVRTVYSSEWRAAALREGVEREGDELDGYAFSPRSTRGATRA